MRWGKWTGCGWAGLAPFQKFAMPFALAVGLVSPPVEPGSWDSDTITLLGRTQYMPVAQQYQQKRGGVPNPARAAFESVCRCSGRP